MDKYKKLKKIAFKTSTLDNTKKLFKIANERI